MKYCFLFAMEAEAKYLLTHCEITSTKKYGFATLYTLTHEGHEFYVCVSGIGKVLASAGAATAILSCPDADAFVNLGIGGSLDAEKAPCLSAVVASQFAQHDMETSSFGVPRGYLHGLDIVEIPSDEALSDSLVKACGLENIPAIQAPMASGDQFIVDEAVKQDVAKTFGALSIDMEGAAYAEICFVHGKPFTALRIVSDAVDHQAEYAKNKPIAGELSCKVGLRLLSL